jgi:hypothetical protein
MLVNYVFNLPWVNAVALVFDKVFFPVCYVEVAVFIPLSDVSRLEPSVSKDIVRPKLKPGFLN